MTPWPPKTRGRPGVNFCGRWLHIPQASRARFGWTLSRLVCTRDAGHTGRHRTRDGWTWAAGDKLHQVTKGAPGGGA